MNIHEYQGKELFRRFGVPTSSGVPAFSVDEAVALWAMEVPNVVSTSVSTWVGCPPRQIFSVAVTLKSAQRPGAFVREGMSLLSSSLMGPASALMLPPAPWPFEKLRM